MLRGELYVCICVWVSLASSSIIVMIDKLCQALCFCSHLHLFASHPSAAAWISKRVMSAEHSHVLTITSLPTFSLVHRLGSHLPLFIFCLHHVDKPAQTLGFLGNSVVQHSSVGSRALPISSLPFHSLPSAFFLPCHLLKLLHQDDG